MILIITITKYITEFRFFIIDVSKNIDKPPTEPGINTAE